MTQFQPTIESFTGIGEYLSNSSDSLNLVLNKQLPENFQVFEILPNGTSLFDAFDIKQLGDPKKGLFFHAILSKRLIDTPHAVSQLARKLKIPKGWISYAGLKDAHALTHQRISIFNFELNNQDSIIFPRFEVNAFCQQRYEIELGALLGNYFKITLNVENPQKLFSKIDYVKLENVIETISTKGFPNYFGLQRFGSQRPISHLIGKSMIKQEWKTAVECYLMVSSVLEGEHIQIARHNLHTTGNYTEFINDIPKSYRYEQLMAQSLEKYPQNYFRALNQLPKTILRLFINSYQSYIFNILVSHVLHDSSNGIPSKLPVIGFETNLDQYPLDIQKIINNLLNKDQITLQNFQSDIPWLKHKGQRRNVMIRPLVVKNQPISYFSYNNSIILEFALPKGCYATMLLREFLKPNLIPISKNSKNLDSHIQHILKFPSHLSKKFDHTTI